MKTYVVAEDYLTDIADAIRDKTGSSEGMEVNEMPVQIRSITGGENGATFIPFIDNEGNLSWTNDKGLENPETVNIKGDTGPAGPKPVKGVDYFTSEDQEAIVQQVITALGTPVFGRVESGNKIVLTGNVTAGTYEYWYEDENGKQSYMCTYEHDGEGAPTYTNVIPLSINADGTDYVGDYGEDGYRINYRIKSNDTEVAQSGVNIVGFIPCVYTDKFYIKDMGLDGTLTSDYVNIYLYNSNFERIGQQKITTIYSKKDNQYLEGVTFDENNRLSIFSPYSLKYWLSLDVVKNTAYVRICSETITENSVITKNEPIE